MAKSNLYFIALLPDTELKEKIKQLKEVMANRYRAKHALKLPAHITLQMPFSRNEEEEQSIVDVLTNFSRTQKTFQIELSHFGNFAPLAIYLRVVPNNTLITLQKSLINILQTNLKFNDRELLQKFTPHITIATRDLSKEMFHCAWEK